jgi:septum formation inhibitor-activating ATPase MinD
MDFEYIVLRLARGIETGALMAMPFRVKRWW